MGGDISGGADTNCGMLYRDVIISLASQTVHWCCKQDAVFSLADYQPSMYHSAPLLVEMRDSLARGERHGSCYRCWDAESKGVRSWRQFCGPPPDPVDPRHVSRLEIQFDNTCDLACIYCGPWYSTAWEAENSDSGFYDGYRSGNRPSVTTDGIGKITDVLREMGRHNNTINLDFTGGEPFLSKNLNERNLNAFMDAFREHAGKDAGISLRFATNTNTPSKLMDETIGILGRIKSSHPSVGIDIAVSMESTGRYFEMSRYLASWDRVDANLNLWLSQPWADVEISSTFNSFTLPDLPRFITYLADTFSARGRTVRIIPNVAYTPVAMSTTVLPRSFMPHVDAALGKLGEVGGAFGQDRRPLERTLVNIGDTLGTSTENKPALRRAADYIMRYRGVDLGSINPQLHSYIYDE